MTEVIRSVNLDVDTTAFFARELEYIKAQSYDVKYAHLKARSILPVSNEAGPGATSVTYYQYDMFGVAKIIGSNAKDIPRADVRGKMFNSPIASFAASYGYTVQDIRSAQMANKPLEQRKANAARRAIEQLINTVAINGDADHNLPGFLTNANITVATAATTGTGSTSTFSTKTADNILADLNGVVTAMIALTKGVEAPDTMLMPPTQYNYCAATPRASYSDKTILQFFLENSPYIKEVGWLNELTGSGVGATDQLVVYRRDADALTLELPQDFEQFPVQEVGLEFTVNCHARCGGTIIYYPLSVSLLNGI